MIDSAAAEFRATLLDAGLLVATSVDGLYLRSSRFEGVVRAISDLAARSGAGLAEPVMYFPPVTPRTSFERTDYLRSFPDLTGSIDTFIGDDRAHAELLRIAEEGGDWTQVLTPADVVLMPAACHPLYQTLEGTVPGSGRRFEVEGYCFRHEPSLDPMRMQSFRMREFVFVGAPDGARAHRDEWLHRGLSVLSGLGLNVASAPANDPFFGRVGRVLTANQRDAELKFEIVTPVLSADKPTAIASANYHLDHFGRPFSISTEDGAVAHSACFGFGLERISLALFRTHGVNESSWPAEVRAQLWS